MRRASRDPYLTPKQLAAELDVTERTAVRFCNNGLVPAFKVGGRWRIESNTSYLDQFAKPQ